MEIAPDAIRGLAALGDENTPDILLQTYPRLRSYAAKMEAINALASRTAFARELLAAIDRESVPRRHVGVVHIRQLRSLGDPEINRRLAALWPDYREVGSEKQGRIVRYKEMLTPEQATSGNATRGRTLFGQLCGTCHTLFGEGAQLGPELTGSDRKNLDYLLNNIIDPSAVVPENYRMSTIRMKDERVINGVVSTRTDRTLTIQTPTEKLVLERREIETVTESELSMMPEGLIESLKPEEVRDLMAYLTASSPPAKDSGQ